MSGFSPEWLALREPVDHASINANVRRAFCESMPSEGPRRIVDIGCGTGSNMRGLHPWLGGDQHWTLLDYDADLLARAEHSAEDLGLKHNALRLDLGSADLALVFSGAHAITSSAFFDLASQSALDRIVSAVSEAGAVFYTVLTYDGIASWLPETPAAYGLRTGFNRHQGSDKGLGRALGPQATDALRIAFQSHGYRVLTGASPWIVGPTSNELRNELDQGWAAAAVEAGGVGASEASEWIETRRDDPEAVTIVGHQDLLAIPE